MTNRYTNTEGDKGTTIHKSLTSGQGCIFSWGYPHLTIQLTNSIHLLWINVGKHSTHYVPLWVYQWDIHGATRLWGRRVWQPCKILFELHYYSQWHIMITLIVIHNQKSLYRSVLKIRPPPKIHPPLVLSQSIAAQVYVPSIYTH